MPTLINPDQMKVSRKGDGWEVVTLADISTSGTSAMTARRWTLQPEAQMSEVIHGNMDELLYVVRGSGQAVVNGVVYALDHESILWLEPGEKYHFVAGPDGLEILQGAAPLK